MPGYHTKKTQVAIAGTSGLLMQTLLDHQQFDDPHGEAERLGISSATWPLFGLLWPSGAQLAARLAARPVQAGERILEIGCGLALASLVAHRLGANVTASDCHPLAGLFLADNLRLNGLPPMPYFHGHWGVGGTEGDLPCSAATGQYDLIVGSDVLYERDVNADLARFIALHASPWAQIWIVDPDRGNRPAFNRHMAALGFAMHEERIDQPASDAAAAYKGRLLVYSRQPPAIDA